MSTTNLTPPPTRRDTPDPTGTPRWDQPGSDIGARGTSPDGGAAGPPPPPPAPRDDRPRGRGGRLGLVAVALVAALSGAAVATPIALLVDGPANDVAPATSTDDPDEAAAGEASDDGNETGTDGRSDEPDTAGTDAQTSTDAEMDVSAVAAAVTPSVVRIDVQGAQGAGSGSGVVYDDQGHVVTNNHVVQGAPSVRVTTADGRELTGEVVGTDPTTDLAVIRVDDAELTPLPIAEQAPEIGESVVAVGSPFGLDGSVTSGIVSALGRTVQTAQIPLTNLVQTDAAINPGNSGGALVDANGELVGINTAIASSGGGSDGIGFAIDTATVTSVADDLIADGEVSRAFLGVRGATATNPDGSPAGAWIDQVVPESPASEAGLEDGDVVVAMDGEPVESFQQMAARLARMEPGTEVSLTVDRDGSETEVTVTLGEA